MGTKRLAHQRSPRVIGAVLLMMVMVACGSRVPSETIARLDASGAPGDSGLSAASNTAGPLSDSSSENNTADPLSPEGSDGSAVDGPTGPAVDGDGTGGAPDANQAEGHSVAACQNEGATDTGVTASELRTGWVGTISGPVPGLFAGAARGVQAYYAMINAQGGVFGRQLVSLEEDDGFETARNRAGAAKLAPDIFAFVGAFSTADAGVAEVSQSEGIPDIGSGVDVVRRENPLNYSPTPAVDEATGYTGGVEWKKQLFPGEITKAAVFWTNVASAERYGLRFAEEYERAGVEVVYTAALSPTEPDFTGHVLQMRQRGVDVVHLVPVEGSAIARMVKAMNTQNFHPVTDVGPVAYSENFLAQTGGAAKGAIFELSFVPVEEASSTPGSKNLVEWHQRLFPGDQIDTFTIGGWTSAHVFHIAAQNAGPCITRDAFLEAVSGIVEFNASGLIPTQQVGPQLAGCGFVMMEVRDGGFHRLAPDSGFLCHRDLGTSFRYKTQ